MITPHPLTPADIEYLVESRGGMEGEVKRDPLSVPPAVIFDFNGRFIRHRGIFLDREAAGNLLAIFLRPDHAWAEALAVQLAEAIRQHDEYWNAQLEQVA